MSDDLAGKRLTLKLVEACQHEWGPAEPVRIWCKGKVIGRTSNPLVRCIHCGMPDGEVAVDVDWDESEF